MSNLRLKLIIYISIFIIVIFPFSVSAVKICSHGHRNPDEAEFCMRCGEKLGKPVEESSQPEKDSPVVRDIKSSSKKFDNVVNVPDYDELYSDSEKTSYDETQKNNENDTPEGFHNILTEDPDDKYPQNVPTNGTLTKWFGTDPRGFNMIIESSADVLDNIYAYVTIPLAKRHLENPDKWAPVLAQKIEVNDDYTEYIITLKKGVRWHSPLVDYSSGKFDWLNYEHYVTAEDIKFYLDIVRNPMVETGGLSGYFKDIISYKVMSKYKIKIKWNRKLYHSLSSTLSITPLPEFLYDYDINGKKFKKGELADQFNNHWYNKMGAIGCGPYIFSAYYPGEFILLERDENYFGKKPPIKRIKYLIYRDPNQNILKIKSMEQDFGILTPSQYRDEVLNGRAVSPVTGEPLKVGIYQAMVYYYIGWNLLKPPFNEQKVREAMTYAFNRKEILENIFYNLGEITVSNVYKRSPNYNEKLIPRTFNLKKAAQLLDEADWIDRDNDGIREKYIGIDKFELKFTMLIYDNSPEWAAVASIFKEDLRKINVQMKIKKVDWAVMQELMDNKNFDAFTGGWGLSWETDPYQIWHSSQVDAKGGSNVIGFKNKEADRIIEKLRITFDKRERKKLLDKFQEILYKEQPYTFIFSRKYVAIWWDYLKNVKFNKLSPHELSLPWYIIPH